MSAPTDDAPRRRMLPRSHSNFAARAATDDAHELDRRYSIFPASPSAQQEILFPNLGLQPGRSDGTYGSGLDHRPSLQTKRRSSSGRRKSSTQPLMGEHSLTAQMHGHGDKRMSVDAGKPKPGSLPRPVGGTAKLGTFDGVFVPTSLNVLSILMFLRFGFILGQSGVVGMMGMLIICYMINLVTTMSISAIATNGTVRGGGAYYLISRSLGPEFGGSIGIVFYLGAAFNTGMNAVGLIECFIQNFGSKTGSWSQWMPEGFWWQYLWATIVLVVCTAICLAGSGLFARCSNGLLAILLVATFSIPFSAFIREPFESARRGFTYTGLSAKTFRDNLMPHFTKGADGSQLEGKETWQDLFGILFPATGGIFAGASMSGDLKHPSKAIPKGTLYGLVLTFLSYTVVILAMAATITRGSFYRDVNIIQDVNISGVIILLGEFATSFFSALMGVIGSAKLLQALARDHLIPGLSIFGQGTEGNDEPTYAIIITYIVAQLTMLSDINQIASFVTMTYLMTFLVTNLACFLLKVSAAPNFRPSFHYFNWWTAAIGTIVSGATMFFVDGAYASGCVGILVLIFLIIHYTTPPKSWGDVSQSLIYHQVRKYLLRLRQEHVKFWRPQILLFVNDPRRSYRLIQFCNSLKKGGLFILGHVIVTQDFGGAVPEARRQQTAWTKYIDFSKIKAFINIAISPAPEWGARNVVLSAGLGGMRPNIVMMGFFNLDDLRQSQPLIDVPTPQPSRPPSATHTPPFQARGSIKRKRSDRTDKLRFSLPTDANRTERAISAQSYLIILEDLLLRLQMNVAIAKGFQDIEQPAPKPTTLEKGLSFLHMRAKDGDDEENTKKFIDLWPIQMSAEIAAEGDDKKNVLTTNFDTYTLILQLGCILNTVPSWKRQYKLRVAVFVEYESDVEEERGRVTTLLSNLRIQAKVLVFWLASGDLKTYEIIVNGNTDESNKEALHDVDEALREEEWWQDVQKMRGRSGTISASQELAQVEDFLDTVSNWPGSSFQHGRRSSTATRFEGLQKILKKSRRRTSVSNLSQLGVSMGMRTHRLHPDLVENHATHGSASESSLSSGESEYDAIEDTDSEQSVASENDLDDYDINGDAENRPPTPVRRSRSLGDSARTPILRKIAPRDVSSLEAELNTRPTLVQPHPEAGASDTALLAETLDPNSVSSPAESAMSPGTITNTNALRPPARPPIMRHLSLPKFTSRPVPRTRVALEDGPGPSIMFTDQPSPPEQRRSNDKQGHTSIYAHQPSPAPSASASIPTPANTATTTATTTASGFPSQPSIPLSFNDLPCRAQHLILNELMRRQSGATAVVFTTLPSPVEGTCESVEDSVRYLSDLEVLCQDLPPVLLVHSNSMTVTMNL